MICPICELKLRSNDTICIRCGVNIPNYFEAHPEEEKTLPLKKKKFERFFKDQKYRVKPENENKPRTEDDELKMRWKKVLEAEKNLKNFMTIKEFKENFSHHRLERDEDAASDLMTLEKKTQRLARALEEAEKERDVAMAKARALEEKGIYVSSHMKGKLIGKSEEMTQKKRDLLSTLVKDNEKLVAYLKKQA